MSTVVMKLIVVTTGESAGRIMELMDLTVRERERDASTFMFTGADGEVSPLRLVTAEVV